jgi:hypothetical protein
MTPADVVRTLRELRFSQRSKGPLGLSFIARQAGRSRECLYNAIKTGHIGRHSAERLAAVFELVRNQMCHKASLGPFGGGTARMRDGGRRRHTTNVDK